jgi:hypothetical protein
MEAGMFLNLSLPTNLSPHHVHSTQWRHNISRTGVHTLSKIIFKQEEAWNKLRQKRLIRERERRDLTKGDREDDDSVANVVKQMKKGICEQGLPGGTV